MDIGCRKVTTNWSIPKQKRTHKGPSVQGKGYRLRGADPVETVFCCDRTRMRLVAVYFTIQSRTRLQCTINSSRQ